MLSREKACIWNYFPGGQSQCRATIPALISSFRNSLVICEWHGDCPPWGFQKLITISTQQYGDTMNLFQTPLRDAHKKSGARMAAFAGWEMPIQYLGIIAEHMHTRNAASLFDTCHMGQLVVSGRYAAVELGRLLTHDLENIAPGRCSYGFMLNSSGYILDDLILYPVEQDRFMLVVNASQKNDDLNHLTSNLSSGVKVTDRTMLTGKLDIQGPDSLNVMTRLFGPELKNLKYFHFTEKTLDGMGILISRTGYTGELGYELYIPWEKTEQVWDMLLEHRNVKPAGLGARDTLRLEAGLPLYGQDLDQHHTPAEAGYGSVLKSKTRYIGRDKALQIKQCLTGLCIEGRRTARPGDKVYVKDTMAGSITSGSFAPSMGHCLAFAYVDKAYSDQTDFTIKRDKIQLKAAKARLPFYQGTSRINTQAL